MLFYLDLNLRTPLDESVVRKLEVGDVIYITGTLFTARDAAHKRIIQFLRENKRLPIDLNGAVIFHCGPLVKKIDDKWIVLAAGPTTSMRMEPYEYEIIRNLGVRLLIGKGGMGELTRRSMKEYGSVYGVFTGGAAVLAARQILRAKSVEWLDLGLPEAIWNLEVERFGPIIIGIDSHGNDLFERVRAESRRIQGELQTKFES